MKDLVTIATFTYPYEVAIVKERLIAEGIECVVQDELTVQVNNFYSNAIGGIKLQVGAQDADRALQILKETGTVIDSTDTPSAFWSRVDRATKRLPYLNRLPAVLRGIILLAVTLTAIIVTWYILTRPGTYDRLTQSTWCFGYLTYEGKDYFPKTTDPGVTFVYMGESPCEESLRFDRRGGFILPGFQSRAVRGHWYIKEDDVILWDSDTLQHVFDGRFRVSFDGRMLTLSSDRSVIHCYSDQHIFYSFPF